MTSNNPLPPKVVIVEDDPDLGPLFAEILQETGYDTIVIADGALAYPEIARLMPQLVILDMHLPHVSGMEILQLIRADERLSQTRFAVASANAALVEQAQEAADATLLKPISLDTLVNTAQRFVPLP